MVSHLFIVFQTEDNFKINEFYLDDLNPDDVAR